MRAPKPARAARPYQPSQRDVAVLLPGVGERLVAQHRKGAADSAAGAARHDDVVDETAMAGDEWIGEFLSVLLGARLDLGRIAAIVAEDDLHRALGPHHGDLSLRPR